MKLNRWREFLCLVFTLSFVLNGVFFVAHLMHSTTMDASLFPVPQGYRYLCPFFRGGLGNLMFMYASIYGMAKEKGMGIGVYSNMELYRLFNISEKPIIDQNICNKAVAIYEYRPCAYDVETTGFKSSINIKHKSYLQSWKYFEKIEDDIRAQFVFKKDIQDKAKNVLKQTVTNHLKTTNSTKRPENMTLIGVHIRRGDFLRKDKIKYGYKVATAKYLRKAFKYFEKKYNNTLFLVFTNPNQPDIKWCKENVNGSDVVYMQTHAREVDMCTLSLCNHTIMTVGTFGWWASWLNQGETVYFKDVATEKSLLREDFSEDMSDYFYPGWKGMK